MHCYVPERADDTWAWLRQWARRERQITEATACVHQLRDLLECAWPGCGVGGQTVRVRNWCAALAVVLDRCNGHPETGSPGRPGAVLGRGAPRAAPLGWIATPAQHHRGGVCRPGRPHRGDGPAARGARTCPLGAAYRRPSTTWRPRWNRAWSSQRQLELTELVPAFPGCRRSGRQRCWPKLATPPASTAPSRWTNTPGVPALQCQRHLQRPGPDLPAGRPRLRVVAWRAGWSALRHNPVMAARYRYLTTRQRNRLTGGQALGPAIAAALLRWMHVVVTRRVAWDAATAGAAVMPAAA